MKVGRIRYGVLQSDAGRIMDDGTIARLSDDTYYVTTTSTGAGAVLEWFEWWNAVWGMDAEIVNVTGALAAVNVAGPRARELMQKLTDTDVSNEALSYLDAQQARVGGVPVSSCESASSASSATSSPSRAPTANISGTRSSSGARTWASGPSASSRSVSCASRRCTSSSGRTPTRSQTSSRRACRGSRSSTRRTSSASGRSSTSALGVSASSSSGFEMENGRVPPEGGQVVIKDRSPVGRVTSARWSPELRRVVGMAWVPPELARDGAEFFVTIDGGFDKAHVRLAPFFDPDERLRS